MAEHLTPEMIEQGRKLLEQASPAPWAKDANWHIKIDGKPGCYERRQPGVNDGVVAQVNGPGQSQSYNCPSADFDTIIWLRNNAPALLAAAELGMAWEAECRKWRELNDNSDIGIKMLERNQISDEVVEQSTRLWKEALALRAATDQLTGRTSNE